MLNYIFCQQILFYLLRYNACLFHRIQNTNLLIDVLSFVQYSVKYRYIITPIYIIKLN